ncbi:L-gulonolactone oxidase 3 [Rutidosis leptorrhynchoides]|uniref:L-gulonolactone oxidase 3 n=1 Tax=Rutidosis leptorrhynchoides TaxID=125765 RepID=UPI003A99A8B6
MPNHTISLLLFLSFYTLTTTTIYAIPPPPPIQCTSETNDCTLHNSYGIWGDRKDCRASKTIYPKTQDQLLSIVADATKNKYKLKVVSKFSHTIPKFACPAPSNSSLLISTENYNSNIDVDVVKLTVTADAGVGLRDLINKVEDVGLSLVAAPYWEGVSVSGLISTGAHGSSWWGNGGSVHDHVVSIDMVVPATQSEGFAKIMHLDVTNDNLFNAAKVSLGTLGIISKVTLRLEKGFKRSISFNFTDDNGVEDAFMTHAKAHEFGDITWYSSKHTAVYRHDDRVSLTTKGDGTNDFLGFQSALVAVSKSTRATEKQLEKTKNVKGKCAMASTFIGYKKLIANGLKNNLLFTGYPVIGRQGKMQTSGSCLYSPSSDIVSACAWDPRIDGLSFYESTSIFPADKFKDFILDVKRLRDFNPDNYCGIDIYNGFLIRFIKASTAFLGQDVDSVVIDFNYYRADLATTPRLNQDVMEEIEQMAFFKYNARPHWAKNRKIAFAKVDKKYKNFSKFVAAKLKMDPQNIFSSDWSDALLFGSELEKYDGCGLEGECVCSEHRHCSPTNGYFCEFGLVYKEARVCRYLQSSQI